METNSSSSLYRITPAVPSLVCLLLPMKAPDLVKPTKRPFITLSEISPNKKNWSFMSELPDSKQPISTDEYSSWFEVLKFLFADFLIQRFVFCPSQARRAGSFSSSGNSRLNWVSTAQGAGGTEQEILSVPSLRILSGMQSHLVALANRIFLLGLSRL